MKCDQFWNIEVSLAPFTSLLFIEIQWNDLLRAKGAWKVSEHSKNVCWIINGQPHTGWCSPFRIYEWVNREWPIRIWEIITSSLRLRLKFHGWFREKKYLTKIVCWKLVFLLYFSWKRFYSKHFCNKNTGTSLKVIWLPQMFVTSEINREFSCWILPDSVC